MKYIIAIPLIIFIAMTFVGYIHTRNVDKLLLRLFGLLAVVTIILSSYFLYLRIPRDSYAQQTDAKIQQTTAHPGDTISWNVTLCKLHNAPFYSQRTLESDETGRSYIIPEINTKSTLIKGQCSTVNPSAVIPSDVKSGNYRIKVTIYVTDDNKNIPPFIYVTTNTVNIQ